ncbi:MAG: ABC transporter permease subunit [Pseudobdellovibrio sp.]
MSLLIGLILALLRYYLPKIVQRNYLFNLLVDLIKFPPPIAWIPFVILLFGISFWSAVLIVIVGGMPPFFTAMYDILIHTEERYRNLAATLQLKKIKSVFFVSLPSQWSRIYTGARVSLGMCWMSIVACEMISSQSGLGYLIQIHRIDLSYELVLTDILIIAVCGYVMNQLLLIVEKKHLSWRQA